MLKYLIIGRVGTGKTFFQNLLAQNGLKVAKSYTTRKQRDESDELHYFVSENEINNIKNPICVVERKGYKYCYTKYELESADIIAVDPTNVASICEMFPDTAFRFIYLTADNEERLKHAVTDAENKLETEDMFLDTHENEDNIFSEFEEKIEQKTLGMPNMCLGHVLHNDFTIYSDMCEFVSTIIKERRIFEKMLKIIETLRQNDIMEYHEETDTYTLYSHDKNNILVSLQMSPDNMTEQIIIDPDGMCYTMTAWLSLDNTHV